MRISFEVIAVGLEYACFALKLKLAQFMCVSVAVAALSSEYVWWSEGKNGKTKNSPPVRSD